MTDEQPTSESGVPDPADPLVRLGGVYPDFGSPPPYPSLLYNLVVPIWDQIVNPAPLTPRRTASVPPTGPNAMPPPSQQ